MPLFKYESNNWEEVLRAATKAYYIKLHACLFNSETIKK